MASQPFGSYFMGWDGGLGVPERKFTKPKPLVCAQLLYVASPPWLTLDLLVNSDQTGADGRPGSQVSRWASKQTEPPFSIRRYGINSVFFFSWQHVRWGEFLLYLGLYPSKSLVFTEHYKPRK